MSDPVQLPPVDQGLQVLPDTNVLNWRSADDSALCTSTLTALCSHDRDHNGDHEAIAADGTVLRRWRNGLTDPGPEKVHTEADAPGFNAELLRLLTEGGATDPEELAHELTQLFRPDGPGCWAEDEKPARPLSPVEIEPKPQAGDRVRGVDLDNVVRVGELIGFFAWNPKTFTNERANLQLDNGNLAVVTTASLVVLKAGAR